MNRTQIAKYNIGQVIRHRLYDMRGVIFDVDASPGSADVGPMSTSAAPGLFYRLFAEDGHLPYVACIAEHDLVPDLSGEPVSHPEIGALFEVGEAGSYRRRKRLMN
jgi:heat shock protein HspQ